MKKIGILGIVLLLILAACAPAQPSMERKEAPVIEKAPAPMETKETAPTQPEVSRIPPPSRPLTSEQKTGTEVVVEPKTTMNPALRDLLKRADEKLVSVQFLYGGTSTGNLFLDTYFVKGTKMKIKKFSENYYVRENYYDNVYVDLGVGCCQELSRCKSQNVDNTHKKFDVDAASLNLPKTPYQWVKEVPSDAEIVGPQTVDSRSVTFIKYTKDGAQVEMWVDDSYGVPHKIVITDANGNKVEHKFNDMKFNGLKDADFDAPCD